MRRAAPRRDYVCLPDRPRSRKSSRGSPLGLDVQPAGSAPAGADLRGTRPAGEDPQAPFASSTRESSPAARAQSERRSRELLQAPEASVCPKFAVSVANGRGWRGASPAGIVPLRTVS